MKFNTSSGQVSRIILILAAFVLVVGIVAYLIIAAAAKPKAQTPTNTTGQPTVQQPVYEKQLGDIDFIFESAVDLGQNLNATNVVSSEYKNKNTYYQNLDKTTTGQFLEVTVGVVNNGKADTGANTWDLGNVIDSAGRNYIQSKGYLFAPWIPDNSDCGAILKPAFAPVFCTQIYEISQESTGLKITIDNKKAAASKTTASKATSATLDLIVK